MLPIKSFKEKAFQKLLLDFPDISDNRINGIINRYIQIVTNEVNEKDKSFQSNGITFFISLEVLYNKSRTMINGEMFYMHRWFCDNCPIFKIIKRGSNVNNEYTEISPFYALAYRVNELYDLSKQNNLSDKDKEEVIEKYYQRFQDNQYDMIPVSISNLDQYIDFLWGEMQLSKYNTKGKETLKKRRHIAKQIRTIASMFNGNVPHIINESEFGRKYYKGLNLQNCSKEVRHAALGSCLSYDIENSVFAWRYDTVKEIAKEYNDDIVLPYTLDYMEFKTKIRESLANKCSLPIADIKHAFTAISFGAQGTGKPARWKDANGNWTTYAINEIIYSPEKRKMFLEDEFVNAFIKEQNIISDIIVEFFKKQDAVKEIPLVQNSNGYVNSSKLMGYLYQHAEREILDMCTRHIKKDNLLLTVHDCFYIKHSDSEAIKSIRYDLKGFSTVLDLERQVHKSFIDAAEEKMHEQHIKDGEARAKGYKSQYCESDDIMTEKMLEKIQDEIIRDFYNNEGRNEL